MAKTKVKSRVEEKVIEAKENLDILSHSHLLVLETSQRDIENAKLSMALEEQQLKNMLQEKMLLDVKIEKQKAVLNQRSNFYESEKARFVQKKKEIWPKYGLKENEPLGYDSATGMIIKDVKQ